jgi:hypothetical protein
MELPQLDSRFKEFKFDADPSLKKDTFKDKRKKLINKRDGRGVIVEPGMSWAKICREILQDGTKGFNLVKVARGELRQTNGWEVEILD